MCAWVMRLIAPDADERPRKAGVALELFQKRGAATETAKQPRVEAGKITDAVTPTIMPLAAPGTQPLVRGTSPVVSSSGRPGSATAGTIAVPITQTGQAAIPSVVGRPVRNRVPATGAAKTPGAPPVLLFGAIGAVVLIIGGIALFKQLTKGPPVVWGKLNSLPIRVEDQPTRRDSIPYPSSRPAPIAKDRLLLHFRADTAVETFAGPQETRPAALENAVAVWPDLGPLNRDNELAHFPWDTTRRAITLTSLTPTPENGLAGPRPVIQFQPEGSPPATLNLAARGNVDLWPFGTAAQPGMTLALVFAHPQSTVEHTLIVLRAKQYTPSLRLTRDNSMRLFAGEFRPDAPDDQRAIPIPSREVDCAAMTIAIVRWRVNPDRVHYTLSNARGQRFESLTEAKKRPMHPFSEITIGGGPAAAYRNPKTKINVFRGSIAEMLLYPAELSDAEIKNLESGLKAHYFK